MIAELRREFLARWTPQGYARLLAILEGEAGFPIPFRVSETPYFLPPALLEEMVAAGRAMIEQLVFDADYQDATEQAVPNAYRVRGEEGRPVFVQVDFGVVREPDGRLAPRLVEIQGFPSLYAFQPVLAEAYRAAYALDAYASLRHHPAPLDAAGYKALLGEAILGGHAPENVVLLEIDPEHQKTRCDFVATEKLLGVRAVCVTKVRQRGSKLYYDRDGVETPIARIYNRAIVDELERRRVEPAFDWTGDLAVEWAGHPNHYFRISKFSIPFLRHACVPETMFLDRVQELPGDLKDWVLKPLYSFAGLGVSIGPSRAEIEAIPASERGGWILQRRCEFAPLVETPDGAAKAEVRIMFVWTDELRAASTIIRMGRGKMIGVDHNKGLDWVGASAGFWPE
jgi:hypothetical protein